MSGITENNQSTATSTENSQSSEPVSALQSNLADLAKGKEDTSLSQAASKVEHAADPLSQTKGKDESNQDPSLIKTEEAEYDLELPKDSSLTEEDLNEIVKIAEERNLNKVEAEKLIAEREAILKKGYSKAEAKIQEQYKAAQKELLSHPEFVGEKKVKSFESISRAVSTFGDQSLIDALNRPDVGNNLAIALFLKKIGDMIASDTIDGKGSQGMAATNDSSKEEALKKLYPSFYENK